jgi:L,D-transpeptidase YcbB
MASPRSGALIVVSLIGLALALAGRPAQAAAPDAGALVIDARTLPRIEDALKRYREIAAGGGWATLAEGRTLRTGDSDAQVAALRRRLASSGDLRSGEPPDSPRFSADVERAVRAFQYRHGLAVDGVVGRDTRAALNVPAAARAASLALNRDRLRELAQRVPSLAVVVNVPAFALTLASRGQALLHSRVIVGKRGSPTPTLDGQITRVEVNPYWNVPPGIARRELAPKIAVDLGYLARNDMKVLAGPPGAAHEVAPSDVDWRHFAATGYRLRQDPGPDNPLGVVKFFFANKYDIFLHDTPAKEAFQRPVRALSHGCVRVENAFTLATLLLGGTPDWSEDKLRAAIATGAHQAIPLARPVPLFIVYVTAWVDPEGTVEFRPDIYGRDPKAPPARTDKACTVDASMVLPG